VKEVGQGGAQRQWPTAQGFRDIALLIESKSPRRLFVHLSAAKFVDVNVGTDMLKIEQRLCSGVKSPRG
jgi:hypothetical protein